MLRIFTVLWIFVGIANSYATVWNDCSQAFEPVEIAAQTVTVPSPAEIDYKAGLGKEFREALAGRTDINWQAVQDHYREWSEHTTTLSGPARMLVACVLSVVTQGMGTSEWLAGHGIAEGTATNAALSSGIQTLAASAGTALASNLGDLSKAFDELTSTAALKNFASTMLTAGISQSVSTSLQLPNEPKTFTDSLKTNTAHGLVRTGVDSAINGGKVGKNLAQAMTTSAVDAGASQVAYKIGDAKATGLNKTVGQLAHAGAGALKEQLKGGDPLAGAIGAVVAETAAEAMDKPGITPEERRRIADKARIIGDTVAFVAGRDVASADKAGSNAVENNFIAHPEASMKIAIAVRDESLSEEERSQKIEEALDYAKAENKVYMTTAAATLAPTITAGYFATQSAAHWAGTYAGGGIEAVKQEFKDHPILSTLDVVTSGMLGAGFVKGMTRTIPTIIETNVPFRNVVTSSINESLIPQSGTVINGRYYTKHALERMAPDTLEVRAELTSSATKNAAKEYIPGSENFIRNVNKNVQPRGIPPSVVENTVQNGQRSADPIMGRVRYYDPINDVTVVTDAENKVIVTVLKGELKE